MSARVRPNKIRGKKPVVTRCKLRGFNRTCDWSGLRSFLYTVDDTDLCDLAAIVNAQVMVRFGLIGPRD